MLQCSAIFWILVLVGKWIFTKWGNKFFQCREIHFFLFLLKVHNIQKSSWNFFSFFFLFLSLFWKSSWSFFALSLCLSFTSSDECSPNTHTHTQNSRTSLSLFQISSWSFFKHAGLNTAKHQLQKNYIF